MSENINKNDDYNYKESRIKKAFTQNIGLKILSLIIAILLWCYVISETNPPKKVVYEDLSLTVTGITELIGNKLTTLDAVDKELGKTTVALNVPYNEISGITKASVEVSVDVSKITTPGTHTLPVRVKCDNPGVTVVSFSPSSIDVQIEELSTAIIPVSLITVGDLPDGLYKGTTLLDPETISISGPQSYVSRITRAQIKVDLATVYDGYKANMQYTYVDRNGNTVNGDRISADYETVLLDMGILSEKTVDVSYLTRLDNADKLSEGYELVKASVNPRSVTIIGRANDILGINCIYINRVDLTGLNSATATLPVTLDMPDGIQLKKDVRASLILDIGEKEITRTLTVPVLINDKTGRSVESNITSVEVTLKGGYHKVQAITEDMITVTADVSALTLEEPADVALTVEIAGGYKPIVSLDCESVRITLNNIEQETDQPE